MCAWLEANFSPGSLSLVRIGADWSVLHFVVNHNSRFQRVAISNTGLPYNPDVPIAVVQQMENLRANKPTPSLTQMQKAIGGINDAEHAAT